ncbi:hypothetical protein SC65A3_01841 [Psychrobacter sp. SC65A.3]|nr:hypothetical protein PSYCG_03820 [Psychrobacter sp. G]WAI88375.1 hypothetical protein SC65A3_01841 [Psychrobacter sp. SC65A.3]
MLIPKPDYKPQPNKDQTPTFTKPPGKSHY